MELILADVKTEQPIAVPRARQAGYWGYFHSDLTDGEAVFVLGAADPTRLLWQTLEVWASQEAVRNFQVLPPGEYAAQLTPEAFPGDYQATGVVGSILWLEEDWEHAVIDVLVGPCKFSIRAEEIGQEVDLGYGQWVSFRVKRLTFWDLESLP